MEPVAFNTNLPLSMPLDRVDAAEWVRSLTPAASSSRGGSWSIQPGSPESVIKRMTEMLGPGPIRWAVEVGDQIALFLQRRYPQLVSDEAEYHLNRLVPECMALVSLESLATGRFRSGRIAVAIAEMMKPGRVPAIPLRDLLRSASDVHARLEQAYLLACEQFVPPERHLGAARAVNRVLLACARVCSDSIVAREEKLRPSSAPLERPDSAEKIRAVSELLERADGHLGGVEKKIGYEIADRRHRACIIWTAPDDVDAMARMGQFTSSLVERAGRSPILVVERPTAGDAWIWWHEPDDLLAEPEARLPKGVRASTASVSSGPIGFRISHSRAMEVRRATQSFVLPRDRITGYSAISATLPFVEDTPGAAAFVVEELGRLASPGPGMEPYRLTLATLLRTQSVSAAGRELYVTRSTVTYRLQKAQAMLPPGWRERPTEVVLALRLLALLEAETIVAALRTIEGPGARDPRR